MSETFTLIIISVTEIAVTLHLACILEAKSLALHYNCFRICFKQSERQNILTTLQQTSAVEVTCEYWLLNLGISMTWMLYRHCVEPFTRVLARWSVHCNMVMQHGNDITHPYCQHYDRPVIMKAHKYAPPSSPDHLIRNEPKPAYSNTLAYCKSNSLFTNYKHLQQHTQRLPTQGHRYSQK